MGRNGSWFASVKKSLSPNSKEKAQKLNKSKKAWLGKQQNHPDADSSSIGGITAAPPIPIPQQQEEEVKSTQAENEQNNEKDYSVAIEANATAEAAAEIVRLTSATQFAGISKEEVAAVKIQTAFRGYLARRGLRVLRGLARFKSLIEGPAVRHQTANTLKYLQTLARVQSQIHSRRMRMLEEDQALQRQIIQKQAKELENLQMSEDWDDSVQSKEQSEAKLLSKYEAAMKRERALAYAFSHQPLKNSSRSRNPMFMDPGNPHWGWSWLERRMAARPWEIRTTSEKDLNDDRSSVKTTAQSIIGGEITRAYAQYQLNSTKASPTGCKKPLNGTTHRSPSTPSSKVASSLAVTKKSKPVKAKSAVQHRRHTIGGLVVRDDESQGSSPAVPSYMVPTESAKAKSSLVPIPLGSERNGTPTKKQLSFTASPRARRLSGPPAVGSSSFLEHSVKNGGFC